MKRTEGLSTIPVHDYRQALQTAVSWLGDRYLLAEPVARRKDEHRSFYVEPRRWHEAASTRTNRPALVRMTPRTN